MISQTLRRSSLTVTTVLALGLAAWGQCSNANVTGKYGYAGGGLDKGGNPIRILGYFNATGKGTFKGNETGSDNGSIVTNLPVTGTYSVNSDCTGSGTIKPKGGTVNHFSLVVLSGGKNLQFVITDAPNVQAGTAQAQGKATCTVAGMKGNFGIEAGGVFLGVGAVAFDGLFTLDGKGTVSGTESGSIAGSIFTKQPVSGTYTVTSFCTGTMTLTVDNQTEHTSFVVTNGGQSLQVVETDANTVVSGFGQQ
jgi:hypothetical protein